MKFSIPGEPVGKGRPRMARTGHTYTPEKTASYENLVKLEFQAQCPGERFGGAEQLEMIVEAYYGIPKSDSRKTRQRKLEGQLRPTKKPDCDNVAKVIADALNGLAYRDDSQIVCMVVEKYYGEPPRVDVEITEAEP